MKKATTTMITRTFTQSITVTYKTVKFGVIGEEVTHTFEGNPDLQRAIKKHESLGKYDSAIIVSVEENTTLYGMEIEDFLKYAEKVER